MLSTLSLVLLGVLVVWWAFNGRRKDHGGIPLPPGPPRYPLIGHAPLIPAKDIAMFFAELSKKYGKVTALQVPGRTLIILNSAKAAIDLLDKRGVKYSSRLGSATFELMGFVNNVVLMPSGKDHARHRKMLNEYLSKDKCIGYHASQMTEAKRLVQNLVSSPEDYVAHLNRFSTAIILRIIYGRDVISNDDIYLKTMADVAECTAKCPNPGSNSVDLLPFLQYFPSWFPGTLPATLARSFRPYIEKMYHFPYDDVKSQMEEGTAKDSFLLTHLEGLRDQGDQYPYSAQDIKYTAGVTYISGADTTWATLYIFILAMIRHPSVQEKVHEEFDRVIGKDRIPSFEDRANLPYLECVVQETYRWNNSVPAGVPHMSTEDDVYEGMFIPKGSIVVANTRGITLDEDVYMDPYIFDPERYLRGEPHPNAQFGFGRRICPGQHLADASVWIAVASILSTFTISPVVGPDGKPIVPLEEFETGIVSHPREFKCLFVPRGNIIQDVYPDE